MNVLLSPKTQETYKKMKIKQSFYFHFDDAAGFLGAAPLNACWERERVWGRENPACEVEGFLSSRRRYIKKNEKKYFLKRKTFWEEKSFFKTKNEKKLFFLRENNFKNKKYFFRPTPGNTPLLY